MDESKIRIRLPKSYATYKQYKKRFKNFYNKEARDSSFTKFQKTGTFIVYLLKWVFIIYALANLLLGMDYVIKAQSDIMGKLAVGVIGLTTISVTFQLITHLVRQFDKAFLLKNYPLSFYFDIQQHYLIKKAFFAVMIIILTLVFVPLIDKIGTGLMTYGTGGTYLFVISVVTLGLSLFTKQMLYYIFKTFIEGLAYIFNMYQKNFYKKMMPPISTEKDYMLMLDTLNAIIVMKDGTHHRLYEFIQGLDSEYIEIEDISKQVKEVIPTERQMQPKHMEQYQDGQWTQKDAKIKLMKLDKAKTGV